jgi:hypothetical protein
MAEKVEYTRLDCTLDEFEGHLKRCAGVSRVVTRMGPSADRFLITVAPKDLRTHEDVAAIRKKAPDITLLKDSVARSGGDPMHQILLFMMLDKSQPVLLVADGGQRLQSVLALNVREITATVVASWHTPEDAARGTVDLNSSRYALTDSDIMSVLAKRLLTVEEVAKLTGRGKSTIQRFETICTYDYMVNAVEKDFIGYVMGAKLIDSCNKNGNKLSALQTSFIEVYKESENSVDQWKRRLKDAKSKRKRFDAETQKRATFSYYGREIKWDEWCELLALDEIEEDNGQWRIRFPDKAYGKSTLAVVCEENPKVRAVKFPFLNVEGREYSDLQLDDLEILADNWEEAGRLIQKALLNRRQQEDETDDREKSSVYPKEE